MTAPNAIGNHPPPIPRERKGTYACGEGMSNHQGLCVKHKKHSGPGISSVHRGDNNDDCDSANFDRKAESVDTFGPKSTRSFLGPTIFVEAADIFWCAIHAKKRLAYPRCVTANFAADCDTPNNDANNIISRKASDLSWMRQEHKSETRRERIKQHHIKKKRDCPLIPSAIFGGREGEQGWRNLDIFFKNRISRGFFSPTKSVEEGSWSKANDSTRPKGEAAFDGTFCLSAEEERRALAQSQEYAKEKERSGKENDRKATRKIGRTRTGKGTGEKKGKSSRARKRQGHSKKRAGTRNETGGDTASETKKRCGSIEEIHYIKNKKTCPLLPSAVFGVMEEDKEWQCGGKYVSTKLVGEGSVSEAKDSTQGEDEAAFDGTFCLSAQEERRALARTQKYEKEKERSGKENKGKRIRKMERTRTGTGIGQKIGKGSKARRPGDSEKRAGTAKESVGDITSETKNRGGSIEEIFQILWFAMHAKKMKRISLTSSFSPFFAGAVQMLLFAATAKKHSGAKSKQSMASSSFSVGDMMVTGGRVPRVQLSSASDSKPNMAAEDRRGINSNNNWAVGVCKEMENANLHYVSSARRASKRNVTKSKREPQHSGNNRSALAVVGAAFHISGSFFDSLNENVKPLRHAARSKLHRGEDRLLVDDPEVLFTAPITSRERRNILGTLQKSGNWKILRSDPATLEEVVERQHYLKLLEWAEERATRKNGFENKNLQQEHRLQAHKNGHNPRGVMQYLQNPHPRQKRSGNMADAA